MQIICLVPVFENTQMLVYKSESCLGAISVSSLVQTVLSVNPGDQRFTVSLSLLMSLSQRVHPPLPTFSGKGQMLPATTIRAR